MDEDKSQFQAMLKDGMPAHPYRLYTYEEAVREHGLNMKTKVIHIPKAILLPQYHPENILDMKPHAKTDIQASMPTLRTIESSYHAIKKKKIKEIIANKKSSDKGRPLFENLFNILQYPFDESILKSSQYIENIATIFRLGYLHPMLLYYLGLFNFKTGVSTSISDPMAKARERANVIRYSLKCFELFLHYAKLMESEFNKEGKARDLSGLRNIKRYIQKFKRRFPLRDDTPDYNKLKKKMERITTRSQMSVKIQYLRTCSRFFYFEGMIHAAKRIQEERIGKFLKSKDNSLSNDPTGYDYIANVLYLMSLSYIHPKVDKNKVMEGAIFFNRLFSDNKISLEASTLHLSLALAAYRFERLKYMVCEDKFRKEPSMRESLALVKLKGLVDRSYRFEMMKYDYNKTHYSMRDYKLTFKHLENMEQAFSKKHIRHYYLFMEKLYHAQKRVHEMAKMHYKAALRQPTELDAPPRPD